ncbi:hypothetical protein tb265_25130 [Gemmatimonadetes bacterium T265]|nr:hypothetical protein tb265_25130 [Gemmatimonadetes bacterium T265]
MAPRAGRWVGPLNAPRGPHVVVLGGPNGAGKSTVAPRLLRDVLGVTAFVNADEIARGLSGFAPEAAAIQAGRIMLERLAELTRERATFAFESTLAGLGMRRVLLRCREAGYQVHLVYLWLPSPELALRRVAQRVVAGGHDIPERDVRRRWARSLVNFFDAYVSLATTWRVYDASEPRTAPAVASGGVGRATVVADATMWTTILAQAETIRRGTNPGEPSP